jgi:aromatic ring-opening dioxygenase LigB subunit
MEPTFTALSRVGEELNFSAPPTIMLISPHGYIDQVQIPWSVNSTHIGDLSNFGAPNIGWELKNNMDVVETICEEIPNSVGYTTPGDSTVLDHGALVPLAFVDKGQKFKLVYGGYCYKDGEFHFNYGKQLGEVLRQMDEENIYILCSGDLSHRLSPNAPAGFNPNAHEFDEMIVSMTKDNNWEAIPHINPLLVEQAGECGFRSWAMFAGLARSMEFTIDVLSYQAPFGVGYMVAKS